MSIVISDKVKAELARWVEGVTPTWAECEHGVIVARGTYPENVTLNKSITLNGAQAGVAACN